LGTFDYTKLRVIKSKEDQTKKLINFIRFDPDPPKPPPPPGGNTHGTGPGKPRK